MQVLRAPVGLRPETLVEVIREGDRVLLYQDQRRKWVTKVSGEKFHTHRGFVELATLIGKKWGETVVTSRGQILAALRPRMVDIIETFDRPTQVLYPKDISYALYQLGVKPGERVLEVGTGSGAMTASLAWAVQPNGHVYTYENRPEFLKAAQANIEEAGLSSFVTFHDADPSEGFKETEAQAVIVDLGDPWKMVPASWDSLVPGGMLAGFTPTMNQLEKLADSLRREGFLILEAVEVMLRQLKTDSGKLRPETRMIGHTAYVTLARKTSRQSLSSS